MTQPEDELACRERVLDEKEHEPNRIKDTLCEKQCSLKAAVEMIQKSLEYLQTQVTRLSGNIEAERSKLQRTMESAHLSSIVVFHCQESCLVDEHDIGPTGLAFQRFRHKALRERSKACCA
jgi:hypothetical protein